MFCFSVCRGCVEDADAHTCKYSPLRDSWAATKATSLFSCCTGGVEKWSLQSLHQIDRWLESCKCWILSSICGIKEQLEFLVGISSKQITGLPRHHPLQGSRQPALISKGGVKEKSLLYPHSALHTPLSPQQTTSHLSSACSLQHSGVHVIGNLSKCASVLVCKFCNQPQSENSTGEIKMEGKWRTKDKSNSWRWRDEDRMQGKSMVKVLEGIEQKSMRVSTWYKK